MKTKLLFILVLTLSIGLTAFTLRDDSKTENISVEEKKPFIVVLDAGHGGHDSGNRGNGYFEKDIVLDVTLQVGKILEVLPDFKVIYTRKTDVFKTLYERGPIANEVDADIFVSIHCNAHHTQANGAETFVMGIDKSGKNLETAKKENEVIFLEENYEESYAGFDPNSPESLIGLTIMQEEYLDQSIMLAGLIQNNIVNNLKRKDRRVKQAPFWVLHSSYMPSVLVELGFLSHDTEGKYINSKKGRKEMAEQIANGILTYKKNLELATNDFQNPVITEQDVDEAIKVSEKKIYDAIDFKVQIAASGNKLETIPQNFKGLKGVERVKTGGLYKYYYGNTSDYNKIKILQTQAKEKGYTSCFIVAYKDGKKLNLAEVLKTEDK
ncbi:putative exported N-acetylmuramoyl-L-alanine amidase [unidentified eubacterium SCB49]|nr:putative exported N-acetylmuramoyl-L-alanine amidase [unidentified eubacterium SCB49]